MSQSECVEMGAGKYIWTGGRPREVVVKIGHCGTETSRRPVVHVWVGSRCAIITYLNGIGHDLQTPVRFCNTIEERKRSRCTDLVCALDIGEQAYTIIFKDLTSN